MTDLTAEYDAKVAQYDALPSDDARHDQYCLDHGIREDLYAPWGGCIYMCSSCGVGIQRAEKWVGCEPECGDCDEDDE